MIFNFNYNISEYIGLFLLIGELINWFKLNPKVLLNKYTPPFIGRNY